MPVRQLPLLLLLVLSSTAPAVHAQSSTAGRPDDPNDLDAFMRKALARREQNRLTLQQYVLDEMETLEVLGPGRSPLYRRNRDYRWYVRDGMHVRSPLRFDGVTVGDDDRREYEEDWIRHERRRVERRKQPKADPAQEGNSEPLRPPGSPIPTPRFVSEAYFLEFKFEPGNYYLAGRELLERKEVLRIEYYPQQMFGDGRERDRTAERGQGRRKDRSRERETEIRIERQMNKTALITLWVDPTEHQIVKYTFENVWMDFLPAGWLVRVDDIKASMTMGQPFEGVWLPRNMEIHGAVTLANGSYEAAYRRAFSDYRQADVTTRLRVPKLQLSESDLVQGPADEEDASGPFAPGGVPEQSGGEERVSEIRVHGNAFVTDADIVALAGISIGEPIDVDVLQQVRRRLESSGRFESVDVRKRYRSLSNTTDVVVVLVVHEKPGVTTLGPARNPVDSSWQRFRSRMMFLPILSYTDGYGFTYGARFSTRDLVGAGERFSFPLSWGGTRRAAVELERTFSGGPLTRVTSTFGIRQRENPHFRVDDRRVEWRGRAERRFVRVIGTGIEASTASVAYGALDDRLSTFGADVTFDTRADPTFPRNAVLLGSGWTRLAIRGRGDSINRYAVDTRGYVGIIGQAVLAGRVQFTAADSPLPPYETLLLGGASTLRGFRAGAFAADRLLVSSAELRVPITSLLSSARFGVSAFFDAGKAYDKGQRFEDAEWHRSIGGGIFLIASVLRLNLDVAHGLKKGGTRLHLGLGFPF